MEQNYLLTFDIYIKELDKIIQSFSWFEHKFLMEEFIESTDNITVIEKIKINSCECLNCEGEAG